MSNLLLQLASSNPATLAQLHQAMFSAGAHGASRSAWVEINRPLTALGLNQPYTGVTSPQLPTGTATGSTLVLPTVSLPIGMDIKSVTCTDSDISTGWSVVNFTFGTLNLVNPQGTSGGVNLSMFSTFLEHEDRLAPWILSKTKVDVQVTAQLQNAAFFSSGSTPVGQPAVFHGFSLNAFQEEQVCAITTRIEPTDRNIGNPELINTFRMVMGHALGLQIPAYQQSPIQGGRVALVGPSWNPPMGAPQLPQYQPRQTHFGRPGMLPSLIQPSMPGPAPVQAPVFG
jgi:hypothetical protein